MDSSLKQKILDALAEGRLSAEDVVDCALDAESSASESRKERGDMLGIGDSGYRDDIRIHLDEMVDANKRAGVAPEGETPAQEGTARECPAKAASQLEAVLAQAVKAVPGLNDAEVKKLLATRAARDALGRGRAVLARVVSHQSVAGKQNPSLGTSCWPPKPPWTSTTAPLSNAGVWAVGKLQTDADRDRIIDGLSLSNAGTGSAKDLNRVVKETKHRWFVFRDEHSDGRVRLLPPRWGCSFMRGPMTPAELSRVRGNRKARRSEEAGEDEVGNCNVGASEA